MYSSTLSVSFGCRGADKASRTSEYCLQETCSVREREAEREGEMDDGGRLREGEVGLNQAERETQKERVKSEELRESERETERERERARGLV